MFQVEYEWSDWFKAQSVPALIDCALLPLFLFVVARPKAIDGKVIARVWTCACACV